MRRRSPLVSAGLLVLGLVFGVVTLMEAQRNRTTATVLKRVAEAVDGHRTGRPVWVVVRWSFPHSIVGVFEQKGAADLAARQAGRDSAGTFGPYATEGDDKGQQLFAAQDPVVKKANSDSLHLTRMITVPAEWVTGVTITVRTQDGGRFETKMDADNLDAVFFTTASIDKLLIPYYERILGADAAAALRSHYYTAFKAAAATRSK